MARAFIITSLALAATAGSSLGLWLALAWSGVVPATNFATLLAAHAQLQVYGFVALYTMGISMMVLPSFLRTTLQPVWLAVFCLVLMLTGIGWNLAGPTLTGGILQALSTLAFLIVLRKTRTSAPPQRAHSTPLTRGHAIFLATGSLWLMVSPLLALKNPTLASETVLWGFAGLFIAGIGLRVHPGILGIKGVHGRLLLPSAVFWNLGLCLRWTGPENVWPWVIGLGAGIFLWALRPFRRPFITPGGGAWLRHFVRTSYLWLLVSVALACLTETGYPSLAGATRHMLGSGFILTMMMGMGLRMIPAFETRRIPWAFGPWVIYVLITLGTVVRVPAQAFNQLQLLAFGGGIQFLGIITFVGVLLATYLWGETVSCDLESNPPSKLFKDENTAILPGRQATPCRS